MINNKMKFMTKFEVHMKYLSISFTKVDCERVFKSCSYMPNLFRAYFNKDTF